MAKASLKVRSVVLNDRDAVKFIPVTSKYGHAAFTFCLRYLRGKLRRVFITPKQQAVEKICYEIDASYGPTSFQISSSHDDLANPWLWFWCKEHGGPAFHCYVPRNANVLIVEKLSTSEVRFADQNAEKTIS